MVSLLSHSTAVHPPRHLLSFTPIHFHHRPPPSQFKPHHPHRRPNLSVHSSETKNNAHSTSNTQQQPQRTLFPGGFKRPEIKVPNLVLQLNPEDVLDDKLVLDVIDDAVSGPVGIVVLNCGEGNGRNLYDAACLLKSVIRDRAYLLIAERVDIAAAVDANGVVVSDQGLPAIVARKTMMDSKSESVFLPLVARYVQTSNAALNASSFEGADFLIYDFDEDKYPQEPTFSVFGHVKIPTFVAVDLPAEEKLSSEISNLLRSGASGLAISLEGLRLLGLDFLNKSYALYGSTRGTLEKQQSLDKLTVLDVDNGFRGEDEMAGFVNLVDRERQFIITERSLLLEAINVIQRAAPLMEEVSLLSDAVAQLSEPFLLVIVGEFNSGKSTFINALLGQKYLKDGVVPTTNEITFLRYSEISDEQQRCQRHPDGQFICYLPAPILKDMIIVDTPGTNVILQRQQRLTEEFVPRADLLLFVISADRPLTESEVAFLRYTQQWKKKVVFVLNKSDIYQNATELEEAIAFIKENTQKLLNTEEVILFPVSARSALDAKLSASSELGIGHERLNVINSHWRSSSFDELEMFLYSFLDGSTSTGIERMKLKLETPIVIAEQLLSASQKLVEQECQQAKQDLTSVNELVRSVKARALKMENDSITWKRQSLSLIDNAQVRVVKVIESTLRLSNLDLVIPYVFRGGKTAPLPATASVQNDIIGPSLLEAQKLLRDYSTWLQSNNAREVKFYRESFERRRPSSVDPQSQIQLETHELQERKYEMSVEVIENFSAAAASKVFEQEMSEVFLGTFGGLGAAGLSASLLTSVLPTTLEDLLALGLCSAGGYIAIANFPVRRQKVVEKVKRTADALARELEEGMQKDLLEMTASLESFVKLIGLPYQDFAQSRLDKLLATRDELTTMEEKLRALQIEIQNLHRL